MYNCWLILYPNDIDDNRLFSIKISSALSYIYVYCNTGNFRIANLDYRQFSCLKLSQMFGLAYEKIPHISWNSRKFPVLHHLQLSQCYKLHVAVIIFLFLICFRLRDKAQSILCDFCGKVFHRFGSLKAHLKLHSNKVWILWHYSKLRPRSIGFMALRLYMWMHCKIYVQIKVYI